MFCRIAILLFILFFSSNKLHADVLIKDVQVINKEGAVSEPTNVYIHDGVIKEIAKTLKPNNAARILNGKGRFLIPGLIDSHVHLNGVPGESKEMPAEVREKALQQIPKSYLYFGFTSVLDLISNDEAIDEWNQQALAPTAYHCAGVPIPGGYPLAWLPTAIQLTNPAAEFYLFDPRQEDLMTSTFDSARHKVKPLIQTIAKTNARCIKAFYEKGFGPLKNLPVPSKEMMRELVSEAKKYKLPVFIHGNSRESHEFAMDTGVELLVHGIWHGIDESKPYAISQLASQMRVQEIGVQPTIQVIYGERELFNKNFFEDDSVKSAMPRMLINWYQSEDGQWFVNDMVKNFSDFPEQKIEKVVRNQLDIGLGNVNAYLRALISEEAELQFGSDTPSGPLYTQFPGFNGREEMTRWVKQGVSLLTLFKALTYRNAQLMNMQNIIGSVEEGKRADLLLLKENPLVNIKAYDSIEWLVLKGKAIERGELAAFK